jgi:ABC-type molybdate transport system substrate-binding protein
VTVFAAGIGVASKYPATARSFVDFLASPAAVPVIQKSALEAVAAKR